MWKLAGHVSQQMSEPPLEQIKHQLALVWARFFPLAPPFLGTKCLGQTICVAVSWIVPGRQYQKAKTDFSLVNTSYLSLSHRLGRSGLQNDTRLGSGCTSAFLSCTSCRGPWGCRRRKCDTCEPGRWKGCRSIWPVATAQIPLGSCGAWSGHNRSRCNAPPRRQLCRTANMCECLENQTQF